MITIRRATLDDAKRLLEIYDYYVKNTAITFEYDTPSAHQLEEMGIRNLYACIAYSEKEDEYLTTNSVDFHAHLGFEKVGEFHRCGYKFGCEYNIVWMEKRIGGNHVTEF